MLLPLLELPVLLARPEACCFTEALYFVDLLLARELDLALVLELDLPDFDVKEFCLEVFRDLARSTPELLPELGLILIP